MSIKVGSQSISNLYYGNTSLKSVYRGDILLYSKTPPEPAGSPLTINTFYSCSVAGAGPPTDDYTSSGAGTAESPFIISVGGEDNLDNRAWIAINKTGTLYFAIEANSEDDYDGGRLYSTSLAPAQHTTYVALGGGNPGGYTAVSSWVDGYATSNGTVAVTAGTYLVLLYTKDSSESAGLDNITASLYVV